MDQVQDAEKKHESAQKEHMEELSKVEALIKTKNSDIAVLKEQREEFNDKIKDLDEQIESHEKEKISMQ